MPEQKDWNFLRDGSKWSQSRESDVTAKTRRSDGDQSVEPC